MPVSKSALRAWLVKSHANFGVQADGRRSTPGHEPNLYELCTTLTLASFLKDPRSFHIEAYSPEEAFVVAGDWFNENMVDEHSDWFDLWIPGFTEPGDDDVIEDHFDILAIMDTWRKSPGGVAVVWFDFSKTDREVLRFNP